MACDSATSCAIFSGSAGAQTNDGGNSFSTIAALPQANATVDDAACGGLGSCFAVGSAGYFGAVVLATNGITSPTFLPSLQPYGGALTALESAGGGSPSSADSQCGCNGPQPSAGEPVNTATGDFEHHLHRPGRPRSRTAALALHHL